MPSKVRDIVLTGTDVKKQIALMLKNTKTKRFALTSPFVGEFGANLIISSLQSRSRRSPIEEFRTLIRVELYDFVHGASVVEGVDTLIENTNSLLKTTTNSHINHLRTLHAKMYLCDWCVVIGSANLTNPGLNGDNDEAAVLILDDNHIEKSWQLFEHLWFHSRPLHKSFWDKRKKSIERVQENEDVKKAKAVIADAITRERIVLQKIPHGEKLADYYPELLKCLKWIQKGHRGFRARSELLAYLEPRNGARLAEKRIEFMQDLGLIAIPDQNVVVTDEGHRLRKTPDSRWNMFIRLLKWCEDEHDDEQLRVLLRYIDPRRRKPLSLSEWQTAISKRERRQWWISGEEDEQKNYDKFVRNSCTARNWLSSLGILRRVGQGKTFGYKKGDLFSRLKVTFNTPVFHRLDEIKNKTIDDEQ